MFDDREVIAKIMSTNLSGRNKRKKEKEELF